MYLPLYGFSQLPPTNKSCHHDLTELQRETSSPRDEQDRVSEAHTDCDLRLTRFTEQTLVIATSRDG